MTLIFVQIREPPHVTTRNAIKPVRKSHIVMRIRAYDCESTQAVNWLPPLYLPLIDK